MTKPTLPGGVTHDIEEFIPLVIAARAYLATTEGQADTSFKSTYSEWHRESGGSQVSRNLRAQDAHRDKQWYEKYGAHPVIDRAPSSEAFTE